MRLAQFFEFQFFCGIAILDFSKFLGSNYVFLFPIGIVTISQLPTFSCDPSVFLFFRF